MTILLQGAGQQVATGGGDPIGDALRAGALAYWKMDESSGTRIDATTHGNDVTPSLIAAPVSQPGKINNCAGFTSTVVSDDTPYFSNLNCPNIKIEDNSFTVFCWVQLSRKNKISIIISRRSSTLVPIDFELYYSRDADNFDMFRQDDQYNSNDAWSASLGPVALNTWYFIVYWYDKIAHTVNMQVNNGAIDSQSDFSLIVASTDAQCRIGNESLNDNVGMDGLIDEIGIILRTTTQDERDYLYNSGAGRALFPAP